MGARTDEPEVFCSRCGGHTPHKPTLWGLKCKLCAKPRPVHGKDYSGQDDERATAENAG